MAGVALLSSASAVSLLQEDDVEIQETALQILNQNVDRFWPELTYSSSAAVARPSAFPADDEFDDDDDKPVHRILDLFLDETFPLRHLAALLLAKIYYHNGDYAKSMLYALQAGDNFTFDKTGQFEYTIISKCIETYIVLSRQKTATESDSLSASMPALDVLGMSHSEEMVKSSFASKSFLFRDISSFQSDYAGVSKTTIETLTDQCRETLFSGMEDIFEACYKAGQYQFVLGVAIEAHDKDVIRQTLARAAEDDKIGESGTSLVDELIAYLLDVCINVIQERSLRYQLLQLIRDHLSTRETHDHFSIAKCLVYLDNHKMSAYLLKSLVVSDSPRDIEVCYQISFDLYENGTQAFLRKVIELLPDPAEAQARRLAAAAADSASDDEDGEASRLLNGEPADEPSEAEIAYTNIRRILSGDKSTELNLEFLQRSNRHDPHILDRVRHSLEVRLSIYHTALTLCNAFMNAGTTNDSMYRNDLEFLSKGSWWPQFTAVAALGVIHRGNVTHSKHLLSKYLSDTNGHFSAVYARAGSLYALGLTHSNNGSKILDYLMTAFINGASDDVIIHGAALGLGLAGMATGSDELVKTLGTSLENDSAISGDAVGLAMGLVLAGTGNEKEIEHMYTYATETEHEKIVRGLSLGMALIMYGRNEAANEWINKLFQSPDSNLRYGSVLMIAMAYCGSGNSSAVRQLLSLAVTDVNDDVRRVAVMSLGFVLFRKPETVPRMVELLADSYNPHVRYGAAMALGIACAGTGLAEAVDLLEPMLKDSVDFVRQGALIALAMILVQQNEAVNGKVASISKAFYRIIGDRHEDSMTKFGCALAIGIIDAGGRNCTIGLQTPTGNLNMSGIIGMMVFTQYWYWFPLAHFLSLSFTPTALIAVDSKLNVPDLKYHCAAKQSLFDYPPMMKIKTDELPEKFRAAVLSTAARAHRRQQAKKRRDNLSSSAMEVDAPTPSKAKYSDDRMDVDPAGSEPKESEKRKRADAESSRARDKERQTDKDGSAAKEKKPGFEVNNLARVLPTQARFLTVADDRYVPVRRITGSGVSLVHDRRPEDKTRVIKLEAVSKTVDPVPTAETGGLHQQMTALQLLAGEHPGPRRNALVREAVSAIARSSRAGSRGGPVPASGPLGGAGAEGRTESRTRADGADAPEAVDDIDMNELDDGPIADMPDEFVYVANDDEEEDDDDAAMAD